MPATRFQMYVSVLVICAVVIFFEAKASSIIIQACVGVAG